MIGTHLRTWLLVAGSTGLLLAAGALGERIRRLRDFDMALAA